MGSLNIASGLCERNEALLLARLKACLFAFLRFVVTAGRSKRACCWPRALVCLYLTRPIGLQVVEEIVRKARVDVMEDGE